MKRTDAAAIALRTIKRKKWRLNNVLIPFFFLLTYPLPAFPFFNQVFLNFEGYIAAKVLSFIRDTKLIKQNQIGTFIAEKNDIKAVTERLFRVSFFTDIRLRVYFTITVNIPRG